MSLRRILVLLRKDAAANATNFLAVYIIVAPIALSLMVTLLFGELFSETPELGFVDEGDSRFTSLISERDFIDIKEYDSADNLIEAVENGGVDIGIVIPGDFDNSLQRNEPTTLKLYVWGERVQKDQLVLESALRDLFTEMGGQGSAVIGLTEIELGERSESLTIEERLYPFLVLMAVVLGGMMVPAISLVEEKEHKTLKALIVTPTSLEDVFLGKALFGILVSMAMALIVLVINQVLTSGAVIVLVTLAIGATASAAAGIAFASYVKDINSLMAVVKATGILLYAPGLLNVFASDIPSWLPKIFPTYYIIGPVIEVTQNGGGWSDVVSDLVILTVMTVVLIGAAALAAQRLKYRLA